MSVEAQFQTMLTQALAADTRLYPVFGDPVRISDEGGQGRFFPFIRLAKAVSEPYLRETNQTLIEHRQTLEVWTRWGGLDASKTAVGLVRQALDGRRLDLGPDHSASPLQVVYVDSFRQSDLRTHLGLVRVKSVLSC